MNYFLKYIKRLGYMILSIFISLIVLTLLYYLNIISSNIFHILELLILLINIFISTYILGKTASNKGYLEGIKFGILMIIILTLITREPLRFRIILYYFIVIITSVLGSMIGINKKEKNSITWVLFLLILFLFLIGIF